MNELNLANKMNALLGSAIAVSSYLIGQHYEARKIPNIYTRTTPSVVLVQSIGSTRNPLVINGERFKIVQGIGTGFAVGKNKILTNYHVISDSEDIFVRLKGDSEPKAAHLVSMDTRNDLALLEIQEELKPLHLCELEPDIGSSVVAIGHPFGMIDSVSIGVVSGTNRNLGDDKPQKLIQTDAPINPGNSGGPLMNVKDDCVIGINTASIQSSGIGFAVPIQPTIHDFLINI